MQHQPVKRVDPVDAPTPMAASPLRRLLFGILVLGLLAALCGPLFVNLKAAGAPTARAGIVDYTRWGPLEAPVELSGQWRFTWLATTGGAAPGTSSFLRVPGNWEGQTLAGARLPAEGVASYSLTLRGLQPGNHVLHVPIIFGANRISVDGRLVGERGRFGTDPAQVRHHYRSHEIPIEATGAPLSLRIDIATYKHRDNGIEAAPVLGLAAPMRTWVALQWAHALLFTTALMLLAAYGIAAFAFRPKDRASLYFALSALLYLPTAAVFRYDNLLLIVFPGLSLLALQKLMYLGGYTSVATFLSYVHTLFPAESRRAPYYAFVAALGGMALAQFLHFAAGDTLAASYLHRWALALIGATLLYITGVVAVAALRGRNGAVVFLLGIVAFFSTFSLHALVSAGAIRSDRLIGIDYGAIGILILLFSHIVIFAERWSIAIGDAENMNTDLRRLLDVNTAITTEMRLDALLAKIVRVTSQVVHADRSSLFIHDPKTDELRSLVAEGVETREIRFPADRGIAGATFGAGETLIVNDAYADPRFSPETDQATGYRTRSILSVPIVTRDGKRLGVMQALNHHSKRGFGEEDAARMTAFAAQAAVAIDNATLFTEVVSARNYNESILRSMSSGVITLDREVKAAKINDAAARILGLSPADIETRDARRLIAAGNSSVLAEIEAVSETGKVRTLLDVDVRTGRGETISANLSIVPLLGESGPVGTLILIEDISEGKRLQSAMRRFMTQKVVDQVLGREDDLLFGTSCQASVLFADIRGFTSLAEALEPRATVEMLNEIFTELFEAVAASDGVLDKFIGDAIMAVYGAPLLTGRDPLNAVDSAVQMLAMIEMLNGRRRGRGLPDLRLGVGIATGDVVAGTIGSPKRMDYTVIGDSVNLAARLQDITKRYGVGIIIDEGTAAEVRGSHALRELDLIQVRGRKRPEKIFQVLHENGGFVNGDAVVAAYAEGRAARLERDWPRAAAAFERALTLNPADAPSALMLERTRILRATPPGADWTGVWSSPS